MKYTVLFAALLAMSACSKSKDHKITVSGWMNDSSYGGNVRRDLVACSYSDTVMLHPVVAGFSTDSLGNFRFELNNSLSGDSIYIASKSGMPVIFSPVYLIPRGSSDVSLGKVLLDTPGHL